MSLKKDKAGKCEKNVKRENDADGFGNKSVQESAVSMRVKNDDGFLSPYSNIGEEIISADVAEFLDNAVKFKYLKNGLKIIIESNSVERKTQEIYKNAIKNYYKNRVMDTERKMRENSLTALIMTILAVVVFCIYIGLEYLKTGFIILAITDIAAWVFAWEAVDLFFIERRALKDEKVRDTSIYNAEIEFSDLSEKKKM